VSHFDPVGLDQKTVDGNCKSDDPREDGQNNAHHLWTPGGLRETSRDNSHQILIYQVVGTSPSSLLLLGVQ